MYLRIYLHGGGPEDRQIVQLCSEPTIAHLTKVIEEVFFIPPNNQEIFFNGERVFEPGDKLLREVGIKDNDEIYVGHSMLRQWANFRSSVEQALDEGASLDVRKQSADIAARIAVNSLNKSHFFLTYPEYQRYYDQHRSQVTYLLGDNQEHLKATVDRYFGGLYKANEHGNFDIKYEPKKRGRNVGVLCTVYSGNTTTKYFVKTHQGGPTWLHLGDENPRLKELVVYLLLKELGVGAEVHLILPTTTHSNRVLFIATREIEDFTEVAELSEADPKAMAQLLFLCQLLRLRDMHMSNCGQGSDGRPLIIDFEVEHNSPMKAHKGRAKVLLENLIEGDFPKWNRDPLVGNPVPVQALEECEAAQRVEAVKEGLVTWGLPGSIDRAVEAFNREKPRLKEWGMEFNESSGVSGKTVNAYVAAIRQDVEVLQAHFGGWLDSVWGER